MAFAHVFKTTILVCGIPTDVEAHYTLQFGLPCVEMIFYAGTDRELPPRLLECRAWEEPANFIIRTFRLPSGSAGFHCDVIDTRFTVREFIEMRLIQSGEHAEARRADAAETERMRLDELRSNTARFIDECRENYGRLP